MDIIDTWWWKSLGMILFVVAVGGMIYLMMEADKEFIGEEDEMEF